ncbi:hypothetical protein NL108_008077 [Boleophthalmus pectinirostris]|nr:hypothetical protein NL108_008077 [Boleophthalmus pectinirostris]
MHMLTEHASQLNIFSSLCPPSPSFQTLLGPVFGQIHLHTCSHVFLQSCLLSFCAWRSLALKAYLVSCSWSMISFASFISAQSWLYFSRRSWFSLRSSTTSWLSSSVCLPQCTLSCSISARVSSMRFTSCSSLSAFISDISLPTF